MKKFFSLVAIAALVFGMASCEKQKDIEVKSDEFGINVTKVTENSVTFDITPSDKTATYDFVIMPASEKDEFDLGMAQSASEENAREGGSLYVGDLKGAQIGDLMSEMEYAIAAYIVDTITGHGSNEATFAIFTTEGVKVSKTVEFNDQQAKMIEQQAKLEESRAKMAEEQLKAVAAAAAKAQDTTGPSKEQLALQKKIDEDTAKLVKARALLKAEKDKIDAEKEKLRREEVERQRRRLYPEYYEKKDAADKAAADKKQSPLDELDEPVSYFNAYDNELDDDELDDLVPSKPKSKPAAAAPAKKPAAPAKKPTPPSAAKPQPKQAKPVSAPVEAKKAADAKSASGDRYVVPVEINGANSDWLIPTT